MEFGVGVRERTLSFPVFEVAARRGINVQVRIGTLGTDTASPKRELRVLRGLGVRQKEVKLKGEGEERKVRVGSWSSRSEF